MGKLTDQKVLEADRYLRICLRKPGVRVGSLQSPNNDRMYPLAVGVDDQHHYCHARLLPLMELRGLLKGPVHLVLSEWRSIVS